MWCSIGWGILILRCCNRCIGLLWNCFLFSLFIFQLRVRQITVSIYSKWWTIMSWAREGNLNFNFFCPSFFVLSCFWVLKKIGLIDPFQMLLVSLLRLVSLNDIWWSILIRQISFSFRYLGQWLDVASCCPLQFTHFGEVALHSFHMWPLSLQLLQTITLW